jgi:hypothetical protein
MTGQSAPHSSPDAVVREDSAAAPVRAGEAPSRAGEAPARRCTWGGAAGAQCLICPGLRLPCLADWIGAGEQSAAGRSGGGPDHPDWPCPPRQ